MSEYPKNRTDLIISETIYEDIKVIRVIKDKYRGLEKVTEFNQHISDIIQLLEEIIYRP